MTAAQRDKALGALGYMTRTGALSAEDAGVIAERVQAGTLAAADEAELLALTERCELLAAAGTMAGARC